MDELFTHQVVITTVKTKPDAFTAQVKIIYCKEQIPAAIGGAANFIATIQPVNTLFFTALSDQKTTPDLVESTR